ncbi:MAG TPA: M48 family metalloprotease [Acidimicrobiales bacterium]
MARRADPADWFDPAELAEDRRVGGRLARIRAARWLAGTGTLAAVAATGAAGRLADGAGVTAWFPRLVLVVAGLEALSLAWDPALDALADRAEGRDRRRVVAGTAAGAALSLAAGLSLGAVVGWAVRAAPGAWWLAAWAVAVAAGAIAGVVEPLAAARPWAAGRRGHGAAAVGIGPARRVVVAEEVVAGPPDVLAAVLAHEAAHTRHHDAAVQAAATAAAALAGAAVLGALFPAGRLRDPASLPALLAAGRVLALAAAVPLAALSRAMERRADAEAASRLPDPAALAAATRRLARRLDPGPVERLLSGHPPPADRLAANVGRPFTSGSPGPGSRDTRRP